MVQGHVSALNPIHLKKKQADSLAFVLLLKGEMSPVSTSCVVYQCFKTQKNRYKLDFSHLLNIFKS